MAIAVAHSSSATEAVAASSVISNPAFVSSNGNLLVGGATVWSSGTPAEAATPWADGGTNTWADAHSGTVGGGGGNMLVAFGYAKNITGKASQTLTFAITSAQYPSVCLIEASGCDTTAPNDVTAGFATGVGTTLASSLVTPAAGEHLLVVIATSDSGTNQSVTNNGTGTATWTTIKNDSVSGEPILLAYAIVTANGTDTYGVTYHNGGASTGLAVGITGFKAASGGGATTAYKDATTRVRVAATNWKHATARIRVAATAFKDATVRVRVRATNWKDAAVRIRAAATNWKDATLRVRAAATSFRNATIRVYPGIRSFRDAALRTRIGATSFKDAALRARVAATAWKDAAVRVSVAIPGGGFKFAQIRIRASVRSYRDAAFRVRVGTTSYAFAAVRLVTATRTLRDATLRVRLSGSVLRDAALRIRSATRITRDATLRVYAGVRQLVDARVRAFIAASSLSDASIRMVIATPGAQATRTVTVDSRTLTIHPRVRSLLLTVRED